MNTTTRRMTRPRSIAAGLLVILGVMAAACAPSPTGGGGGSTPPSGDTVNLTNASFEWTVSRENDHGSFAPGQVNYWSAGKSDSTEATYVPTNGHATVLKKNGSGTYVPIGSEAAVSFANRNRDGNGVVVSASSSNFLGQKVRFTGGTGTLNKATGASTIQWTGTFTINFYGIYVPFWIKDPKLVVNATGAGTMTATVGGYASDMSDPSIRTLLADRTVTIATLPSVSGANTTGFTAATGYLGNAVTSTAGPQVAKTPTNTPYWGAWPQSFVNFQAETGLGTYWFTSGISIDNLKPQEPVTVTYNLAP